MTLIDTKQLGHKEERSGWLKDNTLSSKEIKHPL